MTTRPGSLTESYARERWLTRLLLVPAVAAVVLIATLGVVGRLFPRASLFVVAPEMPFEQAVRTDKDETVFEALRAGTDPNRPIETDDPRLTGGRPLRVRPVTLAVAAGSEHVLQVLLGHGVVLDAAGSARLQCLALRTGRPDLLPVLALVGGEVARDGCAPATGRPVLEGAEAD